MFRPGKQSILSYAGQFLIYILYRKTGIDGALVSGMPSSYVACVAGQKSLASQTHYMSQTDTTLKATSRMMQNVINGESAASSSFSEILAEEKLNEAKRIDALKTPETHDSSCVSAVDSTDTSIGPRVQDNIDPPETEEHNIDLPETKKDADRRKSRGPKKSKKKRRKNRRRSPSTSSSSSDSSTSSSEDEKEMLKRKLKKMEKKMRRMKENVPPPGMMMMPMMMPVPMMSVQGPSNFTVPQFNPGESGQVLSQITQHTVKKAATSTNNAALLLQDEIN